MSSSVFTVRLPDDVKAGLERLAKAANRSKSHIALKAIADYVERNAWQIEELEQAAAEADEGIFVSDEAVGAWVDSWGAADERALPAPDIRLSKKR